MSIKKLLYGLFVTISLAGVLAGLPTGRAYAGVDDFTIRAFEADYYLDRTDAKVSTMRVEETITAVFPDQDQNHGILRAIPLKYNKEILQVKVQSVANTTGGSGDYSTSKSNDHLVLKIGDADKYVHGPQTYRISYTMRNVASFFDDHDELYWNVNGTQWRQPFQGVTARVHVPASLATRMQDRQECFAGANRSNAKDCIMTRSNDSNETVVHITAANLDAGENVTFVLGFDQGTFAPDVAAQAARVRRVIIGIVAGLVIAGYGLYRASRRWYTQGRDPSGRGTIIPQYLPPKGLSVMASDVVLQEKVRSKAVSAQIIELAIQKILTITVVEKKKLIGSDTDYSLELVRSPQGLRPEQKRVVDMLFGADAAVGTTVLISTLKNTAYKEMEKLTSELPASLHTEGYFSNDPTKAKTKAIVIGGVLLVLAGIMVSPVGVLGLWLLGPVAGVAVTGLAYLFMSGSMPARSAKGVETREYLLGLKDYIQLAEADRLKYLQSPEGAKQFGDPTSTGAKIKLFEKLLPYAMLFGLEKEWAKEFQDIYSQPPDWYHGNWNTFNAVYLASSLGSFSTQSVSSFAPPQSSSSSGFGGGGFSGGGGGGGGGGGW